MAFKKVVKTLINMRNITVSIVVPIYNAQTFLDSTIRSIVTQTITDFELILVNDGSIDSSDEICRKWREKDARVKYICQTNAGVTAARAKGVSLALGEWIMFCDADDILPNNALELLLKYSENNDIIIGKIKFIANEKDCKIIKEDYDVTTVSNIVFMQQLLDNSIPLLPSPCARLYKKCLFSEKTFDIPRSIVRGEDFIMNFHYAINAKSICYINNIVYYYRQHIASTMHTFKNSWEYEKLFLSKLLSPVQQYKEYHELRPYIIKCIIRSLGNAYHDPILQRNSEDFVNICVEARTVPLDLLEKITLTLIYFPPKLRFFLYRAIRRILSYSR